MDEIATKICKVCGQEKLIHYFPKGWSVYCPFRDACKECEKKRRSLKEIEKIRNRLPQDKWNG